MEGHRSKILLVKWVSLTCGHLLLQKRTHSWLYVKSTVEVKWDRSSWPDLKTCWLGLVCLEPGWLGLGSTTRSPQYREAMGQLPLGIRANSASWQSGVNMCTTTYQWPKVIPKHCNLFLQAVVLLRNKGRGAWVWTGKEGMNSHSTWMTDALCVVGRGSRSGRVSL